MSSKLELITTALAAYIEADPELSAHSAGGQSFPAVEVLHEQKGDIETAIRSGLTKLGISITVVVADVVPPNTGTAPGLSSARLVVDIQEIFTTNKTGRHALGVAERVAHCAHGKPNGVGPQAGIVRCLTLEPGPNLRLIPNKLTTNRQVSFLTDVIL